MRGKNAQNVRSEKKGELGVDDLTFGCARTSRRAATESGRREKRPTEGRKERLAFAWEFRHTLERQPGTAFQELRCVAFDRRDWQLTPSKLEEHPRT